MYNRAQVFLGKLYQNVVRKSRWLNWLEENPLPKIWRMQREASRSMMHQPGKLDQMEPRILMSASELKGTVFQDVDNDGVKDADDLGIAGVEVFLDADGNGQLDGGEVTVITDDLGDYVFTGLVAGDYDIALNSTASWLPTGNSLIEQAVDGTSISTGHDFGLTLLNPPQVNGTNGDDAFHSTLGNDIFSGANGNDVYYFDIGDGHDVIYEMDSANSVDDQIRFGDGIEADDLKLTRQANDLLIQVGLSGQDSILLKNWFDGRYAENQIDRIFFDGDTQIFWDKTNIHEAPLHYPEVSNYAYDTIIYVDSQTIIGQSRGATTTRHFGFLPIDDVQNVRLELRGDRDPLDSDADVEFSDVRLNLNGTQYYDQYSYGNTYVRNLAEWNGLSVNSGYVQMKHSLTSPEGNVAIHVAITGTAPIWYGTSFNETLLGSTAADLLDGQAGDDAISGGEGDDDLRGGAGNDIYYYNLGDGHDDIYESTSSASLNDKLVFGPDINPEDLYFRHVGEDLVIEIGTDGAGSVTLKNWSVRTDGAHHIDRIEFDNGEVWDKTRIRPYITFDPGVTPDNVTFVRDGNDLMFIVVDSDGRKSQVIRAYKHFLHPDYELGKVIFEDRTIWEDFFAPPTNLAPVLYENVYHIAEDAPIGTAISIDAEDMGEHTLSYELIGTPEVPFSVTSTGEIVLEGPLDFEAVNSYIFDVRISDDGQPSLSIDRTIQVNVTDALELPVVTPAQALTIYEKGLGGSVAGVVAAATLDSGSQPLFEIISGNEDAAFIINSHTGQLSAVNAIYLDDEAKNLYEMTVRVSNSLDNELYQDVAVSIEVLDVGEAPQIVTDHFVVTENTLDVGQVVAQDADLDRLTFSIVGGNDQGVFAINATTGLITVQSSELLDYETASLHQIVVQVIDNGPVRQFDQKQINIAVVDTNDPPEFVTLPELPVLILPPDAIADDHTAVFYYDADAVDGDMDSLVYELIEAPEGMSVNSRTGEVNWLATAENLGLHDIVLAVTDAGTVYGDTNLLVNGSFEQEVLTRNWDVFTEIPGWEIEWGPNFELQKINPAADGIQYVELDSDINGPGTSLNYEKKGASRIGQNLSVQAGQTYQLRFDFAARNLNNIELENVLNIVVKDLGTQNHLIDVVEVSSNTDWITYAYQFTAESDQIQLQFADQGINNTLGTFIDNIEVNHGTFDGTAWDYATENLVANGGFEADVLHKNWFLYPELTGWELLDGPAFELQRINSNADGQYLELDAGPKEFGSTAIKQTVATTVGQTYELRFDFAARDVRDRLLENILDIKVSDTSSGDVLLTQRLISDDLDWVTYQYAVTATGDSIDIQFADGGINNTLGTFLDNVQLYEVGALNSDPVTVIQSFQLEVRQGVNGQWLEAQSGGTQNGHGNVDEAVLVLSEGDSLISQAQLELTVPENATMLLLPWSLSDLQLDAVSSGEMNDAFEWALLDADGNSLLDPFQPDRNAFVHVDENGLVSKGGMTSIDLGQAYMGLDVSHLTSQTVYLTARFLNNDSDTGSQFKLPEVEHIGFAMSSQVSDAMTPKQDVSLRSERVNLAGLRTLTDQLNVTYNKTSIGALTAPRDDEFNMDHAGGGTLFVEVSVDHIGQSSIRGELVMVVKDISRADVALLDAHGFTAQGDPYIVLSSMMTNNAMSNGDTLNLTLAFSDPRGTPFDYEIAFLGDVNLGPVIESKPILSVTPGNTYQYQVMVTDPDNDLIDYTLLDAPAGMSIDASGLISWETGAGDVGFHQVVIVASDAFGLSAEQRFMLEVQAPIENQVPVFTSTPVVQGETGSVYLYQASAIDPDGDRLNFELLAGPQGLTVTLDGLVSWAPTADNAGGTHSVTLKVSDGQGGEAFQSYDILVINQNENDSPQFISTPNTKHRFESVQGTVAGDVTPNEPLLVDIDYGEKSTRTVTVTIPNDGSISRQVDVVLVVDESGSMADKVTWLRGIVTDMSETLAAKGITDVRFAITEFASNDSEGTGVRILDAGGAGVRWGDATQAAQTLQNEVTPVQGAGYGHEDGYAAISQTLGALSFRPNALKHLILLTDENRDVTAGSAGNISYGDMKSQLLANDISMHSILNIFFYDSEGTEDVYGMDVDGNGYRVDADSVVYQTADGRYGGYRNNNASETNETTKRDYMELAFETPHSGAWDIGKTNRNAMTQAFLTYITNEVVNSYDINLVSDNPAFKNLSGPVSAEPGQTISFDIELTGQADPQAFDITFVEDRDDSRTFGSIPIRLNTQYVYQAKAIDADSDTLTYILVGETHGATIDSATGQMTWSPASTGDFAFKMRVQDEYGGFDEQVWLVNVTSETFENTAPQVLSSPVTVLKAGVPWAYAIDAVDPDGDNLNYNLFGGTPAGLDINALTGLVSWTPGDGENGNPLQLGAYPISVAINDGLGGVAVHSFTLTVAQDGPVIAAPAFDSAPSAVTVEGQKFIYQVKATSTEGHPLRYEIMDGPDGLLIDPISGFMAWQPGEQDAGGHAVIVRVFDDYGSASVQTIDLTVMPTNQAPVTAEDVVIEAVAGVERVHQVLATDADGDLLRYRLLLPPNLTTTATLDSETGEFRFTPAEEGLTTHLIEISDGRGGTVYQQLVIQAVANTAPYFNEIDPVFLTIGDRLNLEIKAEDPDGDPLTYAFVNPEVAASLGMVLIDSSLTPGGVTLLWTPDRQFAGRVEVVEVIVTDPSGQSQTTEISITMGEVAPFDNSPAEIIDAGVTADSQIEPPAWTPASSDFVARADEPFVYEITVADRDADDFGFELVVAPVGMSIDPVTGTISWQPGANPDDINSTHQVVVKITEDNGEETFHEFEIYVTPVETQGPANQAPAIISAPGTTGFVPPEANSGFGPVSPDHIQVSLMQGETVQGTIDFDAPPFEVASPPIDIVFLVDESGSMTQEKYWVAETAASISHSFAEAGLTNVRFALVGFGEGYDYYDARDSNGYVPLNILSRTFNVSDGLWGNAEQLSNAAWQLRDHGKLEDGYAGVVNALNTYEFRENALIDFVLVTDEDRDQGIDLSTPEFKSLLDENNVTLHTVVNGEFKDAEGHNQVLGVDSFGRSFFYNNAISDYDIGTDGEWVGGFGTTYENYVDPAWSQGAGTAWNLNLSRSGAAVAGALADAFVDTMRQIKLDALQYEIVLSDPTVPFANFTGSLHDDGTGQVLSWDYELTGEGVPHAFDVQVIRTQDNGVILASLPVRMNVAYLYQVEAVDQDGDDLSYQLIGETHGATMTGNGLMRWEPSEPGVYSFGVMVTDSNGGKSIQSWEVVVAATNEGNQAPAITSTAPVTALTGTLYQYAPVASDPDGDLLRYTLNGNVPAGMTIDTETGLIEWTPVAAGSYSFTLLVSDLRGGVAEQVINLAAADSGINSDPYFDVAPVLTVDGGKTYVYRSHASDPEGGSLSYELLTAPTSANGHTMAIDHRGVAHWRTERADHGDHQVSIKVTDPEGASAIQTFTLTVNLINDPPVVTQTPDDLGAFGGEAKPGERFTGVVKAEDPDGDDLTFELISAPAGTSATIDAQTGELAFTPSTLGAHEFTVNVTDTYGAVAEKTFEIESVANFAPQFVSGAFLFARVAETMTHTIKAVDPEAGELTYAFTDPAAAVQVGLAIKPSIFDTEGVDLSWTPTTNYAGSSLSFDVIATDSEGRSSTQTVTINVALIPETVNRAPEFTSIPTDLAITNGKPIRFDIDAIDRDGDILTYSLDQTSMAYGVVINSATGVLSWTAQRSQLPANGQVTMNVTASDGIASTTEVISVFVAEATKPEFTTDPIIWHDLDSGSTYTYDVSATDPDQPDSDLRYELIESPDGMVIDGVTGEIVWNGAAIGYHDVGVRVIDLDGYESVQTYQLQVFDLAQGLLPPESESRSTVAPGQFLFGKFTTRVENEFISPNHFTYTLQDAPDGFELNPSTGEYLYRAPLDAEPGSTIEVTVRSTDSIGAFATATFTFMVSSIAINNSAPDFNSEPNKVAVAGNQYRYQPFATDPDGDLLAYELVTGPGGMTINRESGEVTWTPTLDDLGAHTIKIRALDLYGGVTEQAYELTVRALNTAPQIVSSPVTWGVTTQPYAYDVDAIDLEGDTVSYSLLDWDGIGAIIDTQTGELVWDNPQALAGTYRLTVYAADSHGAESEQTFLITTLDPALQNFDPIITSTPDQLLFAGNSFSYQVQAVDFNDDLLTYELIEGPAGMTITSAGLIGWDTPVGVDSVHEVIVKVADDKGDGVVTGVTYQNFNLEVIDNAAPILGEMVLNDLVPGQAIDIAIAYSDPDGDAVSFELVNGPAGMVIDRFFGDRLLFTAPVVTESTVLVFTLRATDEHGYTRERDYQLTVAPDVTIPTVNIVVEDAASRSPAGSGEFRDEITNLTQVLPGVTLALQVYGSDDSGGTLAPALWVNGEQIELDTFGAGAWTVPSDWDPAQPLTIVATLTDPSGNVGTNSYQLNVIDTTDNIAPVVYLSSPADQSVLDEALVDVFAVIDDPNDKLVEWRVLLGRDGGELREIFSGTEETSGAIIGQIDTTRYANGLYVLRLEATDVGGHHSFVDHTITIDSELKLGEFELFFDDLSIELGGLPIELQRVYNTIDSEISGDFGFGWDLNVNAADLQVDISQIDPLTDQLRQAPAFVDGTRVVVRLLDGSFQKFSFFNEPYFADDAKLADSIAGALVYKVSGIGVPTFIGDPDTQGTLELDRDITVVRRDDGTYVGADGLPFNPASVWWDLDYKLTMPDGTIYRFDGQTGEMLSAETLTGAELIITDTQIAVNSPDGTRDGIQILRDGYNRIIRMVTSDGRTLNYGYNASGDLVSFLDEYNLETQFIYDSEESGRDHFLSQIINPEGDTVLKAAFDDNGRLASLTDNSGATLPFEYDMNPVELPAGLYRERIQDALGHATETIYDGHGNVVRQLQAISSDSNQPGGEWIATVYQYDEFDRRTHVSESFLTTREDRYNAMPTLWQTISTYDLKGYLISETDSRGNTTAFVNNEFGQPEVVIDHLGNSTRYSYDSKTHQLRSVIDPSGVRTAYAMDVEGHITSAVSDGALIVRLDYDAAGNVIKTTDALGNQVHFDYGSQPAEQKLQKTWFVTGAPAPGSPSQQDHLTITTQIHYNANGEQVGASQTAYSHYFLTTEILSSTSSVLDNVGQVLESTDQFGLKTLYTYNSRGLQIESRSQVPPATSQMEGASGTSGVSGASGGGWIVSRTVYDINGRVVFELDPYFESADGSVTDQLTGNAYVLDGLGRTVATSFHKNVVVDIVDDEAVLTDSGVLVNHSASRYDGAGRVISSTDSQGLISTFQYNKFGDLVKSRQQVVNSQGQLVELVSQTAYDAQGRVILSTDPYEVDSQGNAVTAVYGTRTLYDRLGQALETRRVLNPELSFSGGDMQVDSFGGLVTATKARYDAQGRLRQSTDSLGRKTDYEYDALGRQIAVTGPDVDGQRIRTEYAYDAQGRRSQTIDNLIVDRATGAIDYSQQIVTSVTYDGFGRVVSSTSDQGLVSETVYDNLGRVVETRQQSWADDPASDARTLQWVISRTVYEDGTCGCPGKGGRVLFETDAIVVDVASYIEGMQLTSGGFTTIYDDEGRALTSEYRENAQTQLTGNDAGLFAASLSDAGTLGYTTGTSIIQDGQLLSSFDRFGTETRYSYDLEGKTLETRTQVKDEAGTLNWLVTRYVYDSLDRLIFETDSYIEGVDDVLDANDQSQVYGTSWTYDSFGRVIATFRYAGAAVELSGTQQDGVSSLTELGTLLYRTQSTYDAQGNLIEYVDERGGVTSYTYDQFNREIARTLPEVKNTQTFDPILIDIGGRDATSGAQELEPGYVDFSGTGSDVASEEFIASFGTFQVALTGTAAAGDSNIGRGGGITWIADAGGGGDTSGGATGTSGAPGASGGGIAADAAVALEGRMDIDFSSLAAGEYTLTMYHHLDDISGILGLSSGQTFTIYGGTQSVYAAVSTAADAVSRTEITLVVEDGQQAIVTLMTDSFSSPTPIVLSGMELKRNDTLAGSANTSRHRIETEYDQYGRVSRQLNNIAVASATVDRTKSRETIYEYDLQGRRTRTIATDGSSVSMSYDKYGNMISETDQLGRVTTYDYDEQNRLVSVTLPEVNDPETDQMVMPVYTYAYDALGNQTALIDPSSGGGKVTTFTFDVNGNQLSRTLPEGETENFTYDSLDRMVTHTSMEGVVTEYIYDDTPGSSGRLVEKRFYSQGNLPPVLGGTSGTSGGHDEAIVMTYDARGREVRTEHFVGGVSDVVTTKAYDALGRLLSVTNPAGTISYAYNAIGDLISTITSSGDQVEVFTYDNMGRLQSVRVTERYGEDLVMSGQDETTIYDYDLLGNLDLETLQIGGANIRFSDYQYDDMNRLVKLLHYAGRKVTKEVTLDDQPVGYKSEFNHSIPFSGIDVIDNVYFTFERDYGTTSYLRLMSPSGSLVTIRGSRFSGPVEWTSTVFNGKDANGNWRVHGKDSNDDNGDANYTLRITGRKNLNESWTFAEASIDPSQAETTYTYTYLANGQKASETVHRLNGDQTATTWTYDNLDRVITEDFNSHDNSLDFTTEYQYDLASNQHTVEKDEGRDGDIDQVTTYDYDDNDRLLSETVDHVDDAKDRFTDFDYSGTQETGKSVYEGLSVAGLLLEAQSRYFNLQGRMSVIDVQKYQYDEFDNLVDINQVNTSYRYDFGLMNRNGLMFEEVTVTRSDTNGDGFVNGHDDTTTTIKRQLWDIQNHTASGVAQVIQEIVDGVVTKVMAYGHQRIVQATPADVLFFVGDGKGSTRQLLNARGELVNPALNDQGIEVPMLFFDAYGNAINFDAATAKTSFLYVGESYNAATGLTYLRARFYSPQVGRFNRLDPFFGNHSDPLSFNKYLYTHANPINATDPTGLFSFVELLTSVSGLVYLQSFKAGVDAEAFFAADFVANAFEAQLSFREAQNNLIIQTAVVGLVTAGLYALPLVGPAFRLAKTVASPFLRGLSNIGKGIYRSAANAIGPVIQQLRQANDEISIAIRNYLGMNLQHQTAGGVKALTDQAGNVIDVVVDNTEMLTKGSSPIRRVVNNILSGFENLKPVTVKYRTPNVRPFRLSSEVVDGKVLINGEKRSGLTDFVVTSSGELRVGSGHYFLSDSAEEVLAAGQLYLKDGKIDIVTSKSGHYRPDTESLFDIGNLLNQLRLTTEDVLVQTEGLIESMLIRP